MVVMHVIGIEGAIDPVGVRDESVKKSSQKRKQNGRGSYGVKADVVGTD